MKIFQFHPHSRPHHIAGASLSLQPLIFAMLNQGIERSGVLAVQNTVNGVVAGDVLALSATEVVSG